MQDTPSAEVSKLAGAHENAGARHRLRKRFEYYDEKTGDTYWGEFSPLHDTLNIGTTPYIALLVEVKDAPAKAPPANP